MFYNIKANENTCLQTYSGRNMLDLKSQILYAYNGNVALMYMNKKHLTKELAEVLELAIPKVLNRFFEATSFEEFSKKDTKKLLKFFKKYGKSFDFLLVEHLKESLEWCLEHNQGFYLKVGTKPFQ